MHTHAYIDPPSGVALQVPHPLRRLPRPALHASARGKPRVALDRGAHSLRSAGPTRGAGRKGIDRDRYRYRYRYR